MGIARLTQRISVTAEYTSTPEVSHSHTALPRFFIKRATMPSTISATIGRTIAVISVGFGWKSKEVGMKSPASSVGFSSMARAGTGG